MLLDLASIIWWDYCSHFLSLQYNEIWITNEGLIPLRKFIADHDHNEFEGDGDYDIDDPGDDESEGDEFQQAIG